MVYGFTEFARVGVHWTSVLSIVAGLAFAVVFVRRQSFLAADARREPLLDMAMFRSRGFVVVLLSLMLISPTTGPWPLVVGFALVCFGAAPLPTLGTNLIVGSVPLGQASSAASTSEMSGQLGYALGIALLGSIVTVVYRMQLPRVAGPSPSARECKTRRSSARW